MGRDGAGRSALAAWTPVVVLLLVVLLAGCARSVAGTPSAAPDPSTPAAAAPDPSTADPSAPATPATGAAPVARSGPLESDVLADECLLDAAQFGALLGRDVLAPEQTEVHRDDGTRSSSCYASAAEGFPTPVAAVNVYRVRSGTPAEFVRAAAGRALAGLGDAAALLDTAAGPTLQLAGGRYLVTLVVLGPNPDDEAWRAAARAALARLPS